MSIISFHKPPVLRGEQLNLIPMEHEHAPFLFEINHPDIWEFMLSNIKTLKDMEKWVATAIQQREQGTALPFVVVLKETNQIVGATRLFDIILGQKSCELGHTWYGKDFQKTFVNSNAKNMLLTYCFEELKLVRVQFTTDERNKPSQNAIARLGAVNEGRKRNGRVLADGSVRDAIVYSITNNDWISVKQGFQDRDAKYK